MPISLRGRPHFRRREGTLDDEPPCDEVELQVCHTGQLRELALDLPSLVGTVHAFNDEACSPRVRFMDLVADPADRPRDVATGHFPSGVLHAELAVEHVDFDVLDPFQRLERASNALAQLGQSIPPTTNSHACPASGSAAGGCPPSGVTCAAIILLMRKTHTPAAWSCSGCSTGREPPSSRASASASDKATISPTLFSSPPTPRCAPCSLLFMMNDGAMNHGASACGHGDDCQEETAEAGPRHRR